MCVRGNALGRALTVKDAAAAAVGPDPEVQAEEAENARCRPLRAARLRGDVVLLFGLIIASTFHPPTPHQLRTHHRCRHRPWSLAPPTSPPLQVLGMLVRKLADKDRLQEALLLLDEAQLAGLRLRERNLRELRRRLEKEGMALHPLIGPDPELWRREAAAARRTKGRQDVKKARRLHNMMVGH